MVLEVELDVLDLRLCVGLDDRDGRVLLLVDDEEVEDLLNSESQWQDMTFSISWVRTWKRSIKNIWWGLRASYIGLCLWMRGAMCTVFCACWGLRDMELMGVMSWVCMTRFLGGMDG